MRLQSDLAPQCRHVLMRHVHVLGALDERRHLPARPMRQARLGRRTRPCWPPESGLGPGRAPVPAPPRAVDPAAWPARRRHSNPAIDPPSAATPRQRGDLLLRSILRPPQHDPRPRRHRRRHVRAVHQGPQLGALLDRQRHPSSQQQGGRRRSGLRRGRGRRGGARSPHATRLAEAVSSAPKKLLERAWDENADPFTNAVRITDSPCANASANPGSSPPWPASATAAAPSGACRSEQRAPSGACRSEQRAPSGACRSEQTTQHPAPERGHVARTVPRMAGFVGRGSSG
jgi:hypothetical protein